MMLYLIFSCLIALALYFGFLQYQKRASNARAHHVSVQFKRAASKSPRQNESRSPIENSAGQWWKETPPNTTPNDGTGGPYVQNQNQTRSATINYISPSSMYMTKSTILNKPKQPKKEFTVKLSPFPQMTRNNLKSPNLTLNSSRSVQSIISAFNQSSFASNGSIPQINDRPLPSPSITSPPLTTTIVSRASTKRPILRDDSSEEEFLLKKSKNMLDTFDVDDSETSDQTDLEEVAPNKKAMKRSTLAFESDAQVNSPLKRVKNNEILSSYSSTLVSQSRRQLLNKRKHSPDESTENSRVKKRTYIEELELLTSEISPYYRNIYSPQLESTTTIPKNAAAVSSSEAQSTLQPERATNITPQTNKESKVNGQETTEVVELSDESDVDSSSDSHNEVEIIEPEPELQEETEQSTALPLSTHVFSIKDHEYDKKKSKSRLDCLLAATSEAFDSEEATAAAAPSSNGDLNFSSSTSAFGNSCDTQPATNSATKVTESLGNGESQKGIIEPQLPKKTEPASTSIAPSLSTTATASASSAPTPFALNAPAKSTFTFGASVPSSTPMFQFNGK